MPLPFGFVVKNGSNARAARRVVHADAGVGDRRASRTAPGGSVSAFGARAAPRSSVDVGGFDRQRARPCGIASRAFSTRLMSTCSIWLASALTRARSVAETRRSVWMCSPMTRGSICSRPATRLVEVEDRRVEELLAAEGQQLPRQRGAAVRGLADLADVARGLVVDGRGARAIRSV